MLQGRKHGEMLAATSAMVGRICPLPGWDRVKVSENLGATVVAPVAPAVTSLGLSESSQEFTLHCVYTLEIYEFSCFYTLVY